MRSDVQVSGPAHRKADDMMTRRRCAVAVVLVVGLAGVSGCLLRADGEGGGGATSGADGSWVSAVATVPAGTPLAIRLTTGISTETARVGDRWSGAVVNSVSIGSRDVIASGSPVHGVVTVVHGAEPGARAILGLAVQGVIVAGQSQGVSAITVPVVAGSSHARSLGVVAGGAAVLKPGTVMMFTVREPVTVKQG
jgi:hypothetical protein